MIAVPTSLYTDNHHRHPSTSSTRNLSASFTTKEPLTAHPTTAYSTITAPNAVSNNRTAPSGGLPRSQTLSSIPLPTPQNLDRRRSTPVASPGKSPTKTSLSIASTATYTTATSHPLSRNEKFPAPTSRVSPAKARDRSIADNPAPVGSKLLRKVAPPDPKQSSGMPRQGIPKSRTLGVLSNLTSSFSGSSIIGFGRSGSSKRTSTSTSSTVGPTPVPTDSNPRTGDGTREEEPEGRRPVSLSLSAAFTANKNQHQSQRRNQHANPRYVYTAQSSAYWTGRFVSLQDKLQCQLLLPENLPGLAGTGAEDSEHQSRPQSSNATTSGLTASATTSCISGCIATSAKYTQGGGDRRISYQHDHRIRPQPSKGQGREPQQPQVEEDGNEDKENEGAKSVRREGTDQDPNTKPVPIPDPELLRIRSDKTYRARRALLHLESMCATPEARRSLRAWQQAYARRIGCDALMPRDGSIEDHHRPRDHDHDRDRGWVGRLLGGGAGAGAGMRTASVGIGGGAGQGDGEAARGYHGRAKRESFVL